MAEPVCEWTLRQPAPRLRALVDSYVGYRLTGFPPGVHRGLPSRHLTLIVSIGPAIDVVAQVDPRQRPARYRCVVGGLQAGPALIEHDGWQEGVAIELTPPGCRQLLGVPARELVNASHELADVVGPLGNELWERLQGTSGWPKRFDLVDAVLGRLAMDEPVDPGLGRAWSLVASSGGTLPVADLARTVGYTRQHLARRFRDEYGLPPKLAARIVRFDRARRALQGMATPAIAEVAARCGYLDQSHLTRDFVELAGLPPARLLAAEDLPSVQDPAGLEAAQ